MNFQSIRQKTNRLRALPLPSVLRLWGAVPDRQDPCKWHTARGTLSVNGQKFINWNLGEGGGGAIDLLIHLNHCGFTQALDWLQRHFPDSQLEVDPLPPRPSLSLAPPAASQIQRVKDYLKIQRALPLALIDSLIESGSLYADHRANAVFLLRCPEGSAVGAELRGTSSRQWRGMAPGSRKDLGFFSIPDAITTLHRSSFILCESAIDAISAFVLHPDHQCASTSGARPNPAWLASLIDKGVVVYCGFDADETGEAMAQTMIGFHPSIQRLRPPCHDWNDALKARA